MMEMNSSLNEMYQEGIDNLSCTQWYNEVELYKINIKVDIKKMNLSLIVND
jgi:hypothetical protein